MKTETTWSSVALSTITAMLLLCGAWAGCGDVDTDAGIDAAQPDVTVPGMERLVPSDDSRFDDYEIPEQPEECLTDADCTLVCTTRCSAVPRGPVTCQADPDPLPEDLAAADCLCVDAVCGFWDTMPEQPTAR